MIVNKGVSSVLIRAERQASFHEYRGSVGVMEKYYAMTKK